MKYFLVLFVAVIGLAAHADEDSARSARSSENSPVTQSAEGEGPATNADFGKRTKKTKGTDDMVLRDHKMDSVCQAEGNPDDCYDKTSARNKKKKAAMKKKVLAPDTTESK